LLQRAGIQIHDLYRLATVHHHHGPNGSRGTYVVSSAKKPSYTLQQPFRWPQSSYQEQDRIEDTSPGGILVRPGEPDDQLEQERRGEGQEILSKLLTHGEEEFVLASFKDGGEHTGLEIK